MTPEEAAVLIRRIGRAWTGGELGRGEGFFPPVAELAPHAEEVAAHLRRLAALDHGLAWGAQEMAGRIAALERENTSLRDWISDLAENGACASDRATARTALEARG